jgi:hypothetical protein
MSSGRTGESGRRPDESGRVRATSRRVRAATESASIKSSSSGRGQAELSLTTGLSELEEMGSTATPPPSREELGIGGNGEVSYDLGWGWSSVGLVLLLWAQC